MSLRLDWCSYEAAKYAVEKWHYSHTMPTSKLAKVGVWEFNQFIGAVIFGVGATSSLVKSYGIEPTQGCELVRVALTRHKAPVSRIVAIAIKLLKRAMPGLKLIVSFADPNQGHVGGIYQAGGWIYTGATTSREEYIVNGKRWHGRALRHEKPVHLTTKEAAALMDPNFQVVPGSSKHRYLYPLDTKTRNKVEALRRPYPKRAASIDSDAPGHQPGEGGAVPTAALQKKQAT